MRTQDALRRAQEKDLDLVEVAADAKPPVGRILDYSKYKYEQAQKAKSARKHQQKINVREIKFRPKIAQHDYDTKKGHVKRFLKARDKVKVTIMFRGREMAHPERGEMILNRLAEDLDELAVVEQRPQQDGRNMTMMLGPGKLPDADKPEADAPQADTPPADKPSRGQAGIAPSLRRRVARSWATRQYRVCGQRHEVLEGSGYTATPRHAQDEVALRRQEALQGHRHRQGAGPPLLLEPHPREEVAQAQAAHGAGRSYLVKGDASPCQDSC